jgi:hypothetical protein
VKTFAVILALAAVSIPGSKDPGLHSTLRWSPGSSDPGNDQRATTSRIAGIVVSVEDGRQPIRRAMVTLEGPSQMSQITDDDGRFAFDGVLAGEYDVTATRAAYLPAAYGARRPGRLASRLSVASAAVINDVTLYMARGAAIEGTVRDVNGEPAANVGVVVSLVGQIDMMSSVLGSPWITDDRGMYRAYGLAPGAYTVMATPQSVQRGEIVQPTSAAMDAAFRALADQSSPASSAGPAIPPFDRTVTYGPVFHPNSPTPAQAGVITVAAGDERSGVDINLMLVPTRAIEGIVLDPSGQPASQIQLFISGNGAPSPFSFDAAPIMTGRSTVLGAGRFRYTNVTAGHYTVTAKRPADSLWAKAEVDVSGNDVTGLELRLQPALSMSGRVVFDGKTLAPPASLASVRVLLSSPGGSGGGMGNLTNYGLGTSIAVNADEDGLFSASGIIPGEYLASAFIAGNSPATGWWLRSATINGADAVETPVSIDGANTRNIVFTFSDRHAELSGTLTTPAGQPATDYYVVVIPAGRGLWQPNSRRMKIARPSTAGRYVFADLPPGDYLIAAVTDFAASDFKDRTILEQLAGAAVKVSIAEGAKAVQDLRLR